MKLRTIIQRPFVPWTIVSVLAFWSFISALVIFLPASSCPKSGSNYVLSPTASHAARYYYYDCGGATVGFTQNVDLDGHTVFSTYGSGNNDIEMTWISENELQIRHFERLVNVQTYEPEYSDIKVQYSPRGDGPEETLMQIKQARKEAGY